MNIIKREVYLHCGGNYWSNVLQALWLGVFVSLLWFVTACLCMILEVLLWRKCKLYEPIVWPRSVTDSFMYCHRITCTSRSDLSHGYLARASSNTNVRFSRAPEKGKLKWIIDLERPGKIRIKQHFLQGSSQTYDEWKLWMLLNEVCELILVLRIKNCEF